MNELIRDQASLATTMVDYYGLPSDWPGHPEARQKAFDERASTVEEAVSANISGRLKNFDPRRFIPYVVTHEFEGLLFSDPDRFARGIGRPDLSPQLQAIRNDFQTPEEINDSPDTAPSKRVGELIPGYQKPLMGVLAADEIGLDTIRKECPLFGRWIEKLEQAVRLFNSPLS